ncbi:MAG TPA: hypothetical protein VF407_21115, partial [Polyangiaceae bacterium]
RIPSTVPFRSLDLRVKDEAQAEEILAALGQDPEHATVRFRLQSGFENRVLRGIATVLLMTLSTGNFWWGASSSGFFFYVMLVWMIAVLASLLSFVVPTYVTVGTDGVHIERRGRKRFVRFATVRAIESDPELADAVVIELEGDEKVTLRTSVQDRKGIAATEDGRALRVRLESALARFRARKKEGDALLVLQRGGRTTTEWIASLESLRREQGYRELRVSEEALWSVLEDPSASSEDRAAALVALRGDADDAAKTRRRVALEASAEPRLRVVLAAAEKEDSAELEAAMSALREEEKA